ncbi:MAG TPA: DUF2203 domain-containing protein [Verrucomicrobiota bacterium]|nr:DUF2203 domain-containing protein [Verrucomicrobiota bacterium]HNT15902.1 DUF2203 domain-containing protein [Verrucomicrobiota bacterium]
MNYRFQKHFTPEEATAMLPELRGWLAQLKGFREQIERDDKRLTSLQGPGHDLGGDLVNQWVRAVAGLQTTLGEFARRGILIKDLERGLVDFPALIGGKEVFLCWEEDEETVEFWHDLDAGYGGREKI